MTTKEEKNARRRELAAFKKNQKQEEHIKNCEHPGCKNAKENISNIEDFQKREIDAVNLLVASKIVDIVPEKPVSFFPKRMIVKERKSDGSYSVEMWTNSGLRQAMSCEIEEYADAAIEGMQNLAIKLYKQTFPVETRTKEEN